MPNKRRQPRKGGTRTRRLRSVAPDRQEVEGGLLGSVAAALDSGEPLDLLALMSSLCEALEPRETPVIARAPGSAIDTPTLDELVRSFIEVDQRETTAALTVLAAMTSDDVLASRITATLSRRRHGLPAWLRHLDAAHPTSAAAMTDPLGDGESAIVGVHLADGHDLSIVVYIDHNLGSAVKDGFVIPCPIDDLVTQMLKIGEPDGLRLASVELADARTRISEAIELTSDLALSIETDSWPACRTLIDWVLRMLPENAEGREFPVGDDADFTTDLDAQLLADRFFASTFGIDLDDADHRALLQVLLSYGYGNGPGDPLRWSPVSVEILLLDFVPRAILAEPRLLAKLPRVLRSFIGFCHLEREIPASLTIETQQAVDDFAPEYRMLTASPARVGPVALLSAQGDWADRGYFDGELSPVSIDDDLADMMLESLRRAVGGEIALASLSDEPLPVEDFRWEGIPDDVHPKVREVLGWCDRCCSDLLNIEYRTACRRLLARAARGDPAVFRRKARADTAAAAICWVIGKANRLFTSYAGGLTAKELNGFFGLSSSSQRAGVLLTAAGVGRRYYGDPALGTPDLLVSSRRSDIMNLRDRYLAMT